MLIRGEKPLSGQQRLEDLSDAHAPGAWDWDIASNVFLVTRRFRDIFGLHDGDLIDLPALIDMTLPDDRGWASLLEAGRSADTTFPAFVRFRFRKRDSGELRWIASRIWRAGEAGNVASYSAVVTDITDQIETAQALIESEERLRLAIEAGKMAVWEVDLNTGALTPSPELNHLVGLPPDAKPTVYDVRALYAPGEVARLAEEGATVEVVRDRAVGGTFEPWRQDALKDGADRTQVQAEVSIVTPAGVPKQLMLRAQYAPTLAGNPRLTGLLIDITEKKQAEERLAAVARELQHRVKNLLSVIQTIAMQSLRGKTDIDAALQTFQGRLKALSVATDLILDHRASTTELGDIVDKITRPYRDHGADPFVVSGPPAPLTATAATAMGMVLHELCTNAIKYGALSAAGGTVALHWQRTDEGILLMSWLERGGPQVLTPTRRGFGSRLLESVLSGELRGKVALNFDPSGLHCRIELRS